MHEAGHAAIARVLNPWSSTWAVVNADGRSGDAFHAPLGSRDTALVAAAGRWGERLASQFPPPRHRRQPSHPDLNEQIKTATVATITSKAAERRADPAARTPHDCAKVAMYCVMLSPARPHEWVSHHRRLNAESRLLCWRHRTRIVDAARELFLTGAVILPGRDL